MAEEKATRIAFHALLGLLQTMVGRPIREPKRPHPRDWQLKSLLETAYSV